MTTERDPTASVLATGLVGAVVGSVIAVPFVGFLPLIVTTGGLLGGALVARALIAAAEKKADAEPKDDDKEDDAFDW